MAESGYEVRDQKQANVRTSEALRRAALVTRLAEVLGIVP